MGKSARNENQWQADRIAVRMITAPDSGLINLGSGRTADAPWADTSPPVHTIGRGPHEPAQASPLSERLGL
ncbi:MAG: hypothetical protein OXN89_24905 [Bryobacterales bacterium]|nr:hypothetical protein [Bryobacterales bacterium]MDE0105631.1 hypothetical protein [Bryobacterales bacterium]